MTLVIFPSFWIATKSGMYASGDYSIQDPVVSDWVFLPGYRVIHYEFLHRANFLWSSLRSFGMPLMANEILSAPLFPLTWLSLPFPEFYSFNIVILSRFIIAGAMAILIARQIFRFSKVSSILFACLTVYSVYVLRWINHSWTNGLVAGLGYFYFTRKCLEAKNLSSLLTRSLGLLVFAYAMATCGFPESAALHGLLTALWMLPVFILLFRSRFRWALCVAAIWLGVHALAFAGASFQILPFLELMHESKFARSTIGLNQLSSWKDALLMLTRGVDTCAGQPCLIIFGLMPIFFLFFGLWNLLRRKSSWRIDDWGALIVLLFALLKIFPGADAFNSLFAHLPVFNETWFIVYGGMLLIFPIVYIALRGFDKMRQVIASKEAQDLRALRKFLFFTSPLLLLLVIAEVFWLEKRQIQIAWIDFGSIAIAVVFWLGLYRTTQMQWNQNRFVRFTFVLFLAEWACFLPKTYMGFWSSQILVHKGHVDAAREFTQKASTLKPFEFREADATGDGIPSGIATIDDGATPMLPLRLLKLRQEIFWDPWNGLLPIQKELIPGANKLVARNLSVFPPTAIPMKYVFDTATLRRSYLAKSCVNTLSIDESVQALKNSKFSLGTGIVESSDPKIKQWCQNYKKAYQGVAIESDEGSAVNLERVRGPALLMLTDTLYPGWSAIDLVKQSPLEILPGNLAFRAVILPEAREYKIRFSYVPWWLVWAQRLTLAAVIGSLILATVTRLVTDAL